ncbi:MAG: thioredoxin fold domain-containing protein [Planctomycetota bacterium]|jgi:thioredoxin-related protein
MIFQKYSFVSLLFILAFILPAWAGEGHDAWETDFDHSLALAQKSGKDLLVDFSGSDWCGWCKRLDGEVFSKDAFIKEATKKFVLVVLDFPRNKPAPNPERNQELMKKYGVQSFPTVFLMDNTGKPYARTGYMEGGPDPYLAHLDGLKTTYGKINEKIEKVKSRKGKEMAGALSSLFDYLENLGEEKYDFNQHFSVAFPDLGDVVSRAFEFDPNNESGMKRKAALFLLDAGMVDDKLRKAMNDLDPENGEGLLEKLLMAELSGKDPRDAEQAKEVVRLVEEFTRDKSIHDKEMSAWVHFMAGYACYTGLKNSEKARVYFQAVLKVQPSGSRWSDNARKFLDKIKAEG